MLARVTEVTDSETYQPTQKVSNPMHHKPTPRQELLTLHTAIGDLTVTDRRDYRTFNEMYSPRFRVTVPALTLHGKDYPKMSYTLEHIGGGSPNHYRLRGEGSYREGYSAAADRKVSPSLPDPENLAPEYLPYLAPLTPEAIWAQQYSAGKGEVVRALYDVTTKHRGEEVPDEVLDVILRDILGHREAGMSYEKIWHA